MSNIFKLNPGDYVVARSEDDAYAAYMESGAQYELDTEYDPYEPSSHFNVYITATDKLCFVALPEEYASVEDYNEAALEKGDDVIYGKNRENIAPPVLRDIDTMTRFYNVSLDQLSALEADGTSHIEADRKKPKIVNLRDQMDARNSDDKSVQQNKNDKDATD